MEYEVIVLGGGAAGLFCAFHAARRGRSVAVLEHNAAPGRKILISGGGRCNFTNRDTRPECFLSSNPHFAKSALARYGPQDFLALLDRHGVAWHEKHLGQLFCDHSAKQILELLVVECRQAGVVLRTGVTIHAVRKPAQFELETSAGGFRARSLVVATGGLSVPKTGATGFAYELARQFQLRVIEPRPGLVPLTLARPFTGLSGVSCPVRAALHNRSFDEKLLFTHRGLSGPAILQISSYWQPGQPLSIDLLPGLDMSVHLLRRKQAGEKSIARSVLSEHLPARLAAEWAPEPGPLLQHSDAALRRIAGSIHRWHPAVDGTEGFEKAEVTVGGVDTEELSSQTMESRSVPGLYWIGECVDVTGWLGGYNFQWAWASGYAAGQSI